MRRKLTVSLHEAFYQGLFRAIGPRRIRRLIERFLRPQVAMENLDHAYAQMALEEERGVDATNWADALIADSKEPEA